MRLARWAAAVAAALLLVGGLVCLFCGPPEAEPSVSGVGEASPFKSDLVAHDAADLTGRIRAAMSEGRGVRVLYRPEGPSGSPVLSERNFWCRLPTDEERARALRYIARIRSTSDKMFEMAASSPLEQEEELANMMRSRVMCDAAADLISKGHGFLVKGLVGDFKSDDKWHYWNLCLRVKPEGELLLYVPMDLTVYQDVKHYRDKALAIREFAQTEKVFQWNSLDFATRRAIVDSAAASRKALVDLEIEHDQLKSDGLAVTPVIEARLRNLASSMRPYIDPVTLEWGVGPR
jgi:hypothetical protein